MINKVVIVGGGTSGWWCAGYLRKKHPELTITLIESPVIPTIGVGESTMPNVKSFFEELEISEAEWMDSCSAIKKKGNLKSNFNHQHDEPFNFMFINNAFEDWFEQYLKGKVKKESVYDLYDINGWRSYGYHLDASKAWQIVKKHTKDINHIITHINTNNLPEADLYVDCTGFNRILIKDKSLKKYPDTLVNSCIVRRIKEKTKFYTESIAMNYGWEFNVYLSDNRVGCGYVFDKHMISVEQAKQEYMKKNSHREFLSDFKIIEWEPGRLQNMWQNNVVSLGLSSGFIDPLESNSLSILVAQIRTLSKVLKKEKAEKIYNKSMGKLFDQVADYIWHHYACTQRNDTEFWKHFSKLEGKQTLFERIKKNTNLEQNLYPSYVYGFIAIYYGLI